VAVVTVRCVDYADTSVPRASPVTVRRFESFLFILFFLAVPLASTVCRQSPVSSRSVNIFHSFVYGRRHCFAGRTQTSRVFSSPFSRSKVQHHFFGKCTRIRLLTDRQYYNIIYIYI
jgi:hypothetical protein